MSEQPNLFSYDEWCAMSEEEREQWRELRRLAVEDAQREHQARGRLNDALTVERFSRDQP